MELDTSRPLSRRTLARKLACDVLYQMEITGDGLDKVLDSYRVMLAAEEGGGEVHSGELPGFAGDLARAYLENRGEIDGLIASYADRWSLERMPMVDRNLLRLGFVELLYREDIPTNVTINEYLELAKAYSTGESGKFINGVMGKLVRERHLDG